MEIGETNEHEEQLGQTRASGPSPQNFQGGKGRGAYFLLVGEFRGWFLLGRNPVG